MPIKVGNAASLVRRVAGLAKRARMRENMMLLGPRHSTTETATETDGLAGVRSRVKLKLSQLRHCPGHSLPTQW